MKRDQRCAGGAVFLDLAQSGFYARAGFFVLGLAKHGAQAGTDIQPILHKGILRLLASLPVVGRELPNEPLDAGIAGGG